MIQEGLLRTYDIKQERFASPLNLNPDISVVGQPSLRMNCSAHTMTLTQPE